MSEPAKYLTVAQVAAELGFSRASIYKWIDTGILEAAQLGTKKGSLRIARTSLDSFIERSKRAAVG